jgi:hypothetical protein
MVMSPAEEDPAVAVNYRLYLSPESASHINNISTVYR